jgi:hypothetical protein
VVILLALLALWLLVGIDAALDHRMLHAGIKPRQLSGLPGIVVSPVLHAGAAQLSAISIPFAVLGWLMLVSGYRSFGIVTGTAWLVSGIVGWLAGPTGSYIVGISAVVLGWLGFLLARAWFGRKVAWIATAVAVAVVFSGMFTELLPGLHNHLFWGSQVAGFVVGVLLGAVLHGRSGSGAGWRLGRNRPVS